MARLVLTVFALVLACVVADYASQKNHGVRDEDDRINIEEKSSTIEAEPGTTKVTLPSGRTAYIKNHDDMMKETSRCGSKTILLKLEPCDEEYKLIDNDMQSTIRPHAGSSISKYNITKIERVINGCLLKKYKMRQESIETETGNLNERMLFFESSKLDNVVARGFDERSAIANPNGLFGAGLYFTEYSSKANHYAVPMKDWNCVTCERKMLISRVTLGNIYKTTKARTGTFHAPAGYDSVQGVASPKTLIKYDEYVIHRVEQAYPDYLITYSLVL